MAQALIYEETIGAHPDYAPAFINLGTIHFKARAFKQAEYLYRRAIEVDPGSALAFFNLGNVLEEMGSIPEAIAAYEQAVVLAPRYADPLYNLALIYHRSLRCGYTCASDHIRAALLIRRLCCLLQTDRLLVSLGCKRERALKFA